MEYNGRMVDNNEAETPSAPDESANSGALTVAGPAYKMVFLKLDAEGVPTLWGQRWTSLSAKIYDRRTAMKYAVFEAQRVPAGSVAEILVALINPGGRCIAVLSGGTGKPVRPLIALRTKRALPTLMPGDVVARRRTSRPLAAPRSRRPAAAKRRTSRGR